MCAYARISEAGDRDGGRPPRGTNRGTTNLVNRTVSRLAGVGRSRRSSLRQESRQANPEEER